MTRAARAGGQGTDQSRRRNTARNHTGSAQERPTVHRRLETAGMGGHDSPLYRESPSFTPVADCVAAIGSAVASCRSPHPTASARRFVGLPLLERGPAASGRHRRRRGRWLRGRGHRVGCRRGRRGGLGHGWRRRSCGRCRGSCRRGRGRRAGAGVVVGVAVELDGSDGVDGELRRVDAGPRPRTSRWRAPTNQSFSTPWPLAWPFFLSLTNV